MAILTGDGCTDNAGGKVVIIIIADGCVDNAGGGVVVAATSRWWWSSLVFKGPVLGPQKNQDWTGPRLKKTKWSFIGLGLGLFKF